MLNALLLLTSIGSVTSQTSTSCFTGCQTCQIIFYFIYCTQCSSNRNYNPTTGLCDCITGTYDTGSSCQACPYFCQTCNSQACLTCSADKYLDPLTKRCLCSNGRDYDSQGSCDSSSMSLSLIIGITVGVSLGLSCLLTIIYMIRRRNYRIFDRDQSPRDVTHHRPRQNPQIVVEVFRDLEDSSAYSTYPQNKHQSKNFQFKEEVCSICLEDSPYFMTECGHFFHEQCITVWLKKRGSCPNCNQIIELIKIRKWCNSCKKQLIYPQKIRLVTVKKPVIKETPTVFWPSCPHCQGIQDCIDLQSIKK